MKKYLSLLTVLGCLCVFWAVSADCAGDDATSNTSDQPSVAITRVLATPDRENQTHHSVIYLGEVLFLDVHYILAPGVDTVTAMLTVKDADTGQMLDEMTLANPRKPLGVQQVSIQEDMSRFSDGQAVIFTAGIRTPDGGYAEKSASFHIHSFRIEIDAPDSMVSGQMAVFSAHYPARFEEPVTFEAWSDSGLLIVTIHECSCQGILTAGHVEDDSRAVITVQVTDAKGRTARAGKLILLSGTVAEQVVPSKTFPEIKHPDSGE